MKIYRHFIFSEENIDNKEKVEKKEQTAEDLYHTTKIDKALNILKTDTFKCDPWNNLSTSTIENFHLNAQNACFVLDRVKLENDFVVSEYDETSGQDGVSSENEVRIISDSDIRQFSKYIKELRLNVSDPLFSAVLSYYDVNMKEIDDVCRSKGVKLVEL